VDAEGDIVTDAATDEKRLCAREMSPAPDTGPPGRLAFAVADDEVTVDSHPAIGQCDGLPRDA
jgi:hypothetical protein